MIKYALHPGQIRSWYDGDWHFISAATLANLYNVSLNECVIVNYKRPETIRSEFPDQPIIHLYPRSDGEYKNMRESR
jgi:hypothetical protein